MGIMARVALRSINNSLSRRFHAPHSVKALSTNANTGDSFESADDFEQRIFGGTYGNSSSSDSFFQKLDRLQNVRNRLGSQQDDENDSHMLEGLDDSFTTLSDGMDEKLEEAATYFDWDSDEVEKDNYSFRPDVNFLPDTTYELKDLDLTKPGVYKPPKRWEFETTTEEVLRKADFRNVRFLANFITEAGIIIKRSKTGISAKAQRKVAREIKTARAFGLMPFTTMGTKSFTFGKTMEDLDDDYEFRSYNGRFVADANGRDFDEDDGKDPDGTEVRSR